MRPPHLLWLGPLALSLGGWAGFFFGRPGLPVAGTPPPADVRPQSPEVPIAPGPDAAEERAELERRAATLEARLARKRPDSDPVTRLSELRKKPIRDLLLAIDALKPADAKRFVEAFDAEKDVEEQGFWIACVLACGGPDAQAFVVRSLDEKNFMFRRALSRYGADFADLRKLEVTPEIETRAAALLGKDLESHRAGVALLARSGSPAALAALRRAADVDTVGDELPEILRGLRRCGDAATLAWIEGDLGSKIATLKEFERDRAKAWSEWAAAGIRERLGR